MDRGLTAPCPSVYVGHMTTNQPYIGQPATIHLFTDARAAVVVRVNKKSISVAAVETGPERRDPNREGVYPVMIADGITDKIVGKPERYPLVGQRYRNGSISVSLGRSYSLTDHRY